jgi:hypothetical protein
MPDCETGREGLQVLLDGKCEALTDGLVDYLKTCGMALSSFFFACVFCFMALAEGRFWFRSFTPKEKRHIDPSMKRLR